MNKKPKGKVGNKRAQKRRATRVYKHREARLDARSLDLLIKKARYMSEHGVKTLDPSVRDIERINEMKLHAGKSKSLFCMLAFIDGIAEANVIPREFSRDTLINLGRKLLNVEKRLNVVANIDEDEFYMAEIYTLGTDLLDAMELLNKLIEKIDNTGNRIDRILSHVAVSQFKDIPESAAIDQILEISGQHFLQSYVLEKKPEVVPAPETATVEEKVE